MILFMVEGVQQSRYSDWLRAGRPGGRSSRPRGGKNFHFSMSSRPALGPTQPPMQRVPEVKRPRRGTDHSPPTSAEVKKRGSRHPLARTFSWRSA
jgi:hypothetical protein